MVRWFPLKQWFLRHTRRIDSLRDEKQKSDDTPNG
jgi:hypothetical protein